MSRVKKTMKIILLFCIVVVNLAACGNEEQKEVLLPPDVNADDYVNTDNQIDKTEENDLTAQKAQDTTQKEIKLFLNGNSLDLVTKPYIEESNVMVPISEICSYFSRDIICELNEDVLMITDEKNEKIIEISKDSDKAIVNGTSVELKSPAVLTEEGIMMVELSSFGILLDADNKYQEDISAAYITESGLC